MATRFDEQADPMGFISFLGSATRIPVVLSFHENEGWMGCINRLSKDLEQIGTGQFRVMLGDERKLSDTDAHFSVYTDDDAVAEYVKGLS